MVNNGKLLEDFSEKLFQSIKGFVVRYKRVNAKTFNNSPEHDYDLVIHNTCRIFPELGNYILVECKDWTEKVGYPEVAKFLHKLHSRKCRTGIIVALNNVVYGDFNPTLKRTYDQDGIIVIVLNKGDIDLVMKDSRSLANLLRQKYEAVRFGLIK